MRTAGAISTSMICNPPGPIGHLTFMVHRSSATFCSPASWLASCQVKASRQIVSARLCRDAIRRTIRRALRSWHSIRETIRKNAGARCGNARLSRVVAGCRGRQRRVLPYVPARDVNARSAGRHYRAAALGRERTLGGRPGDLNRKVERYGNRISGSPMRIMAPSVTLAHSEKSA
jgi:hypothetical protein